MTTIDKKDLENIEKLHKILKSKNLATIKVKKENYEIEVSIKTESAIKSTDISLIEKQRKTSKIQEEEIKQENIVSSPLVGVVYLSPEPTKPFFIKEGQHVKQGDVLMLIEAMKTFNEIKAPKSGVIKKIVALNNQPVEFGESLVIFE